MDSSIRPVSTDETPFLWQILCYAAHMDEGGKALEAAKTNPDLMPYVTNWGTRGIWGRRAESRLERRNARKDVDDKGAVPLRSPFEKDFCYRAPAI